MTLDSLPDLDTSGLCLVKTLSTALTCWPYRNTALRDGARTSTRTSSDAQREDGLDTLPARAAEANRSTLIADIPFPAPGNVAAKRRGVKSPQAVERWAFAQRAVSESLGTVGGHEKP